MFEVTSEIPPLKNSIFLVKKQHLEYMLKNNLLLFFSHNLLRRFAFFDIVNSNYIKITKETFEEQFDNFFHVTSNHFSLHNYSRPPSSVMEQNIFKKRKDIINILENNNLNDIKEFVNSLTDDINYKKEKSVLRNFISNKETIMDIFNNNLIDYLNINMEKIIHKDLYSDYIENAYTSFDISYNIINFFNDYDDGLCDEVYEYIIHKMVFKLEDHNFYSLTNNKGLNSDKNLIKAFFEYFKYFNNLKQIEDEIAKLFIKDIDYIINIEDNRLYHIDNIVYTDKMVFIDLQNLLLQYNLNRFGNNKYIFTKKEKSDLIKEILSNDKDKYMAIPLNTRKADLMWNKSEKLMKILKKSVDEADIFKKENEKSDVECNN